MWDGANKYGPGLTNRGQVGLTNKGECYTNEYGRLLGHSQELAILLRSTPLDHELSHGFFLLSLLGLKITIFT